MPIFIFRHSDNSVATLRVPRHGVLIVIFAHCVYILYKLPIVIISFFTHRGPYVR